VKRAGRPDPSSPLFEALTARGWKQDLAYAADGPDGTLFALENGRNLRIVRGRWDGGNAPSSDGE
jgi:hypothetical protein